MRALSSRGARGSASARDTSAYTPEANLVSFAFASQLANLYLCVHHYASASDSPLPQRSCNCVQRALVDASAPGAARRVLVRPYLQPAPRCVAITVLSLAFGFGFGFGRSCCHCCCCCRRRRRRVVAARLQLLLKLISRAQWNVAVCAGYLLFKEFCEQCDEPVPQLQFYEEVRVVRVFVFRTHRPTYEYVLCTPPISVLCTRLADFLSVSVNRGCSTRPQPHLQLDSIGLQRAALRGAPLVTARPPPLLDMRLERCHAQNC